MVSDSRDACGRRREVADVLAEEEVVTDSVVKAEAAGENECS